MDDAIKKLRERIAELVERNEKIAKESSANVAEIEALGRAAQFLENATSTWTPVMGKPPMPPPPLEKTQTPAEKELLSAIFESSEVQAHLAKAKASLPNAKKLSPVVKIVAERAERSWHAEVLKLLASTAMDIDQIQAAITAKPGVYVPPQTLTAFLNKQVESGNLVKVDAKHFTTPQKSES